MLKVDKDMVITLLEMFEIVNSLNRVDLSPVIKHTESANLKFAGVTEEDAVRLAEGLKLAHRIALILQEAKEKIQPLDSSLDSWLLPPSVIVQALREKEKGDQPHDPM